MRCWAVFVGVFVGGVSWGQFSEVELDGLGEVLYFDNLRVEDLKFPREGVSGVAKNELVKLALGDPVGATERLMGMHRSGLAGSGSAVLGVALSGLYERLPGTQPVLPEFPVPESLPPKTSAIVTELVRTLAWADNEIRESYAALTPEEVRLLIESLPVTAVEEPRVKFAFVRGQTVGIEECKALLAKVDLARLMAAGRAVVAASEKAADALATTGEDVEGKVRLRIGEYPVLVAGKGSNLHDELDARLTIDLGGNDVYTGRHGAGVGYSGVLIDLGGDDRVDVPDLSVGAGVMGVGCAIFRGGKDTFEGDSLNFGSGLAGIGFFSKDSGSDHYKSIALGQGFGFFGAGVLVDGDGNDTYDLSLFGQGAARTQGVGWLVDRKGRDIYRAGGAFLNSPLFASAHYSFAQGFGMGFREDTGGTEGGIGMLTDGSGDDFYLGETYAQAASYWFSVGSVYDGAGNDSYIGHHYSQASAMHMTGAYLFDLAGDDAYTCKVGAAQAIGHDYGVAVLLDRAGDDIYASRDARPGTGLAAGLGLFLDSAGIDKYTTLTGYGRFDRSYGSLGVFADLGGADVYAQGVGNGAAEAQKGFSVAMDLPDRVAPGGDGGSDGGQAVTPGSKEMPGDAAMESLYAAATQWGVGTAQEEVQESLRELVAIGVPALEWMLDKKLATANRLHIRAYVHVVQALGAEAAAPVGRKALNSTDEEMATLLRIATDAKLADMGAVIPSVIANRPALRRRAVQAAGALKTIGAVNAIMPLLRDEDPMLAREAMVALELIGDKSALGTAASMVRSDDMLLRRSAMRLVAQFPTDALVIAEQLMASTDEVLARRGVEILGLIDEKPDVEGRTPVMDLLVANLLSPRPGVRISVLNALKGRVPESAVEIVKTLQSDPIPAVRMAAQSAMPGGSVAGGAE